MARNDGVQKRSGGGVERRRTVPLWGPLTLVVVVAVGSLLVMQVQTLPDPLPASAMSPLPERGTPVDAELADAGEELYRIHCAACHRDAVSAAATVGPSLAGVTARRTYAWIRGMVQEPDSMHREDPVARRLLLQWRVPMRDVGLSEPAFRAVLEHLRWRDRPPGAEAPPRYGPERAARDTGAAPPAGVPVDTTPPASDEDARDVAPARSPAGAPVDTVEGSRVDPGAMEPPPLPPGADTLSDARLP